MQKINLVDKFKLFSTCHIVRGKTRSIIYDLQRKEYSLIPNDLWIILSKYNNHSINEVLRDFDSNEQSTLEEYFSFLVTKEYIFFSKTGKMDFFLKLIVILKFLKEYQIA